MTWWKELTLDLLAYFWTYCFIGLPIMLYIRVCMIELNENYLRCWVRTGAPTSPGLPTGPLSPGAPRRPGGPLAPGNPLSPWKVKESGYKQTETDEYIYGGTLLMYIYTHQWTVWLIYGLLTWHYQVQELSQINKFTWSVSKIILIYAQYKTL